VRNEMYLRIGAGTGIFTRALLSHPVWDTAVAKLEAVDPSLGMREMFTKSLGGDARVSCKEGTFAETGLPTGWADVVFVAQVHISQSRLPSY
jgi:hypothetical protein